MEGKYDVTLNGQAVGTVELNREGLYYRLSCRCRMVDNEIHRLYADGERIGVLVPERGALILNTKMAGKRLKDGCNFTLDGQNERFIPILPGDAFGHLDKLRTGRLVFRDGQPGLVYDVGRGLAPAV